MKAFQESPKRLICGCAVAILAILLTACATSGEKFPPAPAQAGTQDYSYVIGPGDTINIIVWRNPELSMSVPVRPDGKISTPLVDELVAQGKNSVETRPRHRKAARASIVRDPVVTVIVTASSALTASRCGSSARRQSRSSCLTSRR